MSTYSRSQTPTHVEYRNATYYGQISNDYRRNGKGMIILDTSTILFADWKDNQIEGMYIYISDGIRAYGTMSNGKLDGYNIISTTSSYSGNGQTGQYSNYGLANSNKIRTFYGQFRSDKIYGKCLLIDNDTIITTQFNNHQLQQIISKSTLHQRELYQLLKQIYPNNIYTLDQYLTKFIKNYIQQLEQLDEITRYQPCINYFSKDNDQKFYGFQEIGKEKKKFGILMIDNQLISVGQHNNNVLHGIGRMFTQEHIYDGAFRNGQIDGIGIDFHKPTNKFILEVHDGIQDRVEKGFGFPLRKQFHLRSIFFYNDIVVLNLKSKFQALIGHIFINQKRPTAQQRQLRDFRDADKQHRYTINSRSGSKRIQNSPLRQRLTRYQMESDIIQDSSPIKNRPNQYKPVDKTSNYFRQQKVRNQGRFSRTAQISEGYQQSRNSRSRFTNYPTNHASNRSQQRNQRFSQDRSKNKFQQRQSRQRQTYNQIIRQNPNNQQTYAHLKSFTNTSPYIPRQDQQNLQNRNRKDTRDLVKQLQNQEKQRRLTLDEIYSKSNLYGRKR